MIDILIIAGAIVFTMGLFLWIVGTIKSSKAMVIFGSFFTLCIIGLPIALIQVMIIQRIPLLKNNSCCNHNKNCDKM